MRERQSHKIQAIQRPGCLWDCLFLNIINIFFVLNQPCLPLPLQHPLFPRKALLQQGPVPFPVLFR